MPGEEKPRGGKQQKKKNTGRALTGKKNVPIGKVLLGEGGIHEKKNTKEDMGGKTPGVRGGWGGSDPTSQTKGSVRTPNRGGNAATTTGKRGRTRTRKSSLL